MVLVRDIEGIEAGTHGRLMGLCDDTVMVGCRMRERLHVVLVHTWDVLPELTPYKDNLSWLALILALRLT